MKIIVPMAGRGSRLRPHSLTVPKPLIPVAGQPIVHRLVKDIVKVLHKPIDEIAFVIGGDPAWFGDDVVARGLKDLAKGLGAKESIYLSSRSTVRYRSCHYVCQRIIIWTSGHCVC